MKRSHRISLLLTLVASVATQSAFAQSRTRTSKTTTVKKQTVGEYLSQANDRSRGGGVQAQGTKADTSLPSSNLGFKEEVKQVNLDSVKPPRSSEFMQKEKGNRAAEYERILDQQIRELYKLTQKFKTSPNRGELWLRLAELYVEKAGIVDGRKQDDYDARLRAFQTGKSKVKPKMDDKEAREYNRKAVQLYEWFQRDFPKDEKMPQALFFLGYNYFELGDVRRGAEYYEKLTRGYPNSPFVGEAHFALAEYYFENERWSEAYKEYSHLIKEKKHRLHTFALYKGAWCLFRLNKVQQAMNYLEYIIKTGKADAAAAEAGQKRVNRNRLEGEAQRDIVVFYAEGGDPTKAYGYFKNLIGGDVSPYLERLAYQYSSRGDKEASREVFKVLIAQNPTSPKSFEFQYQIVQNFYYAKNTTRFKAELYSWIKDYNQSSAWYAQNKNNKELIENSYKLRETTLRNYVLQQHQTAQNSRSPSVQANTSDAYNLYLKEFPDSAAAGDMHFYYGELLYDMGKYDEASAQYKWVVDNAPQSKFYSKAAQNLILSVERSIPTDQEMQKRIGQSLDPVPLEPRVDKFIKAGNWYVEKFPNSEKSVEIKFRIGRLYYQSNHFDEATKSFKDIVQKNPNTKYAEYSANLLLDIYNLRKDYAGLEKVGAELLTVPSIASSKAGSDIRGVLEKASFKRGQDLEVAKKYGESGQAFESFAKQNPKSELAVTALFNAGVNYERAGMNLQAIGAYQEVLNSKSPSAAQFKTRTQRLLAKQYQDSARFEEAAKLYRQVAQENPTDPLSPNMIFNAAVLYEVLGRSEEAIRTYNEFMKVNKKKSENAEIIYAMATIHRKAGQTAAAVGRYMEYVEGGGRDQEKVVESAYWVHELSKKQNAITRSKEWGQKTMQIQRRFAPNKKGVGASYAAKIRFQEALEVFREMKAVTFPKDPNKQKAAADKKVALLTKLASELADVIKYDSGEEIVSSLAVLAEANLNMAQAIINAPLPPGLNAEETKQYKAGVEKFAEPFNTKVRESYKLAVDRGLELEVYNNAYREAYQYMSQVDPKTYYNGGEVATDMRAVNWMGQ
ncbi:adventurous gliding motility protein U [Bdellovibrio bacteriovorus]|uniref:Adventurous gliding motility protein U n=1 Tax=Bdellovibrio bacteriovorus TaxID=959 RepID=A0A150WSN9_BDEBC|nr:tetratricopeptide repeat protein [Bdellovibrio bacteriovorus]KYG67377.1 adventurous gliding motility protein U [Bdellovibrio bacteriovorus]